MARLAWLRVLWPIVFYVPLATIADKFCSWPLMDPIYHSILWMQEHLAEAVALVGGISLVLLALRVVRLRARFETLISLSDSIPQDLQDLFEREAAVAHVRVPQIAYLDVPADICYTIVGPIVMVSRRFLEPLTMEERALVVRHELAHVRRRDPMRGLWWHLLLQMLPVPGTDRFEQWLYGRRERAADDVAGSGDPEAYARLLRLCRRSQVAAAAGLCSSIETSSHADSAFQVFFPPAVGVAMIVALLVRHAFFSLNLPYLLVHHCPGDLPSDFFKFFSSLKQLR